MKRPQVSDRGILLRINRALASDGRGEQLHRTRPRDRRRLGTYHLVGSAGDVLRARLQLQAFAEEIGVARAYQARRERAAERRQRERSAAEAHAVESDSDDEEIGKEEEARDEGRDEVISLVTKAVDFLLRSGGPDEQKFIERLRQRIRFEALANDIDLPAYWF